MYRLKQITQKSTVMSMGDQWGDDDGSVRVVEGRSACIQDASVWAQTMYHHPPVMASGTELVLRKGKA